MGVGAMVLKPAMITAQLFFQADYCLIGAIGHDFYKGQRQGSRGFPRFTDPALRSARDYGDYLRMAARLAELIQNADGLDLARAKTPFGDLKWVKIKMPLGARLAHLITHDRRHLWQAEQVRNGPNFPIV